MSGAADPASAVTDMMHETKTTEPTKQQLLNNNLHNQQINNQPINQQQNIQKQAREITQTKKLQKKNSSSTPADVFFNLLLDNIKPKDAWELAGCDFEVNSKKYKAITQRARRVMKAKSLTEEAKINEAKKLRQQKVLQHKFVSVQQHRHEANRCLDKLAVVLVEKKQMQKRMDELEAVVETVNSRWVSLY